jgi:hypothetical protein|tara:strand:- start:2000 stop:2281 length:282 start_codon:yes stop_codon:yes gene_type:complete
MKKTVDRFLDLDVEIKELTKKRAALRTKLLGSRPIGTFIPGTNGVGVLVVEATKTTIDSKAFKAELPELAARFSKTNTSVSLRISDEIKKAAA